jgi:hypothetical protein
MARPMPRDPPVTTATLPVMSCSAAKEVTGRSCHARGLRDGGAADLSGPKQRTYCS